MLPCVSTATKLGSHISRPLGFTFDELRNDPHGPIDSCLLRVPSRLPVVDATLKNRLPQRSSQHFVLRLDEDQRQLNVLKLLALPDHLSLNLIGDRALCGTPSTSLPQHSGSDEVDDVTTAQNLIAKRVERIAPQWVLEEINPGNEIALLKSLEDGKDERVAVFSRVRKECVEADARPIMDEPFGDHVTPREEEGTVEASGSPCR